MVETGSETLSFLNFLRALETRENQGNLAPGANWGPFFIQQWIRTANSIMLMSDYGR
jgi:hypothetical protein